MKKNHEFLLNGVKRNVYYLSEKRDSQTDAWQRKSNHTEMRKPLEELTKVLLSASDDKSRK